MSNTQQLVLELKENNQDFEFYPTTKSMISKIYEHFKLHNHVSCYGYIQSFLDIGCGTCNFLKYMNEFGAEFDYYVMEKSKILLDRLPKDTIVLGTDFNCNSLIDKNVDAIFCNPPYSEFENWTYRIIKESNAKYIYLVIPQRWKDNKAINILLEQTKATATVLGSFDFLNAERQARAKVDVIVIDKTRTPQNKAFDDWFDETYKLDDKKIKNDYLKEEEEQKELKNQLVAGKNKIEILVNSYNDKMNTLNNNFKAITSLDADILEDIGIDKATVKESLRNRICGLKNVYWKAVFDELDEITSRLTHQTKETLIERFKGLRTIDFNAENIYSLVIWVCKNSSAYYDEQLVELYKTFTTPDNIIKYKSNQKVFQLDKWGKTRFENPEQVTHYCLSYRIICDRLYFRKSYSWDKPAIDTYKAQTIIDDLSAIAHNLGFQIASKDIPQSFGEKYYILQPNGKPLIEFKVYQNGNTHIKLDIEFAKAMNVEVSRLLGWIRNKQDISKEFPDELSKDAEKYFGRQHYLSIANNNIKLLA